MDLSVMKKLRQGMKLAISVSAGARREMRYGARY
jgi:hypothetical protein